MERWCTSRFGEIEEVRKNWGWFLALGILLLLLGFSVIGSTYKATIYSIILLGVFLIGAGIVQIVQSFLAKKWTGLFMTLLLGILYLVAGFLFVAKPNLTAITLTLWIATFCFVVGIFKMLSSLLMLFDNWGWVFFNGLVTFCLGVVIYTGWPLSGLWVIGLFVGIDMILTGWSWILLSLLARKNLR